MGETIDESILEPNLNRDGVLAVQVPNMIGNRETGYFNAILDAINDGPWKDALMPLVRFDPVKTLNQYYEILSPLTDKLSLWETSYCHIMSGDQPVREWAMGTALRPYVNALDDSQQQDFIACFDRRIEAAYPQNSAGITLFPFRRLFVIAQR